MNHGDTIDIEVSGDCECGTRFEYSDLATFDRDLNIQGQLRHVFKLRRAVACRGCQKPIEYYLSSPIDLDESSAFAEFILSLELEEERETRP